MSTVFSQNDSIEIGNDTVRLFRDVPVIRFESASFLGLFGEVELIVSGCGWDGGVCDFLHEKELSFLQTISAENYKSACFAGRVLAKATWSLAHNAKYTQATLKFMELNTQVRQREAVVQWRSLSPIPASIYNHKNLRPNQLCILSRDQFNRSTLPIMFFDGGVVDCSFSISHVDSHVAVFFAKDNGMRIGCDLVNPDSITANLRKLFYKQNELNSQLNSAENLPIKFHNERIWSVKETAFKILGNGRTFKPEQWLTVYSENGWYQCTDIDTPDQKKINIRTQIIKNKILAIGCDIPYPARRQASV
ncbi:MAG: hypothetical protein LBJ00_07445 [Planctomycetaceae bacterium]|nr:hypothetical protein [Planctomycetaceae bacterium]